MTSVAVLQARTNSSRLPGKVLLPICGIPLVALAAKRAANTGRKVIVATSLEQSDDALADVVQSHGLTCFRGSLENTLNRVVKALSEYDDSTLVFRLTADNVFPDGGLLDEVEKEFLEKGLDYLCCNGELSGLPYGMSVEVTRLGYLREADRESISSFDQEHVTPYVIRKFGVKYFEKYKSLGKGRYRCTIDCLDDYLGVFKVFSGLDNPVEISAFDLLANISQSEYQPIAKSLVPKLVMGTAQLGINYGIANKSGRPDRKACQHLLKTAIANGVAYLDTARAYGVSEEVIGQSLSGWEGRVKIITKLSPLTECPADASVAIVKSFVDASIYNSCACLRMQSLDVVMLHRAAHLLEWSGAIWQQLKDFKDSGVIRGLGVSVQSPEEIRLALSFPEIGFIQMPLNLLDWRWDSVVPDIRAARSARKLVIHARSALLQGLLPSQDMAHWLQANVENHVLVRQWLEHQVVACSRVDITDLCLAYVNSLDWIDGVSVGMETQDQLIRNINIFNAQYLSVAEINNIQKTRPLLSESVLNPIFWKSNSGKGG